MADGEFDADNFELGSFFRAIDPWDEMYQKKARTGPPDTGTEKDPNCSRYTGPSEAEVPEFADPQQTEFYRKAEGFNDEFGEGHGERAAFYILSTAGVSYDSHGDYLLHWDDVAAISVPKL